MRQYRLRWFVFPVEKNLNEKEKCLGLSTSQAQASKLKGRRKRESGITKPWLVLKGREKC